MSQSPNPPPPGSLGLPKPIEIPSKQPPTMVMRELEHLEKIVREGKKQFVNVGYALLQIRDKRGYKLRGFQNFEDYCEEQFGFSRQQGYRLMDAAKIVESVQAELGEGQNVTQWVTNAVETERQAREIKKTGVPAVVEAVKEALDKAGGDPAKALKTVLKEQKEKRDSEKASKASPQPRLVRHEDAEPEHPDDLEFETTVRSNTPPAPREEPHIYCPQCRANLFLDRAARITHWFGKEK